MFVSTFKQSVWKCFDSGCGLAGNVEFSSYEGKGTVLFSNSRTQFWANSPLEIFPYEVKSQHIGHC